MPHQGLKNPTKRRMKEAAKVHQELKQAEQQGMEPRRALRRRARKFGYEIKTKQR